MKRYRALLAVAGVLAAAAVVAIAHRSLARDTSSLERRMAGIVRPGDAPALDCAALARQRPLVLLALGQSNAGNHGRTAGMAPLALVVGERCVQAHDPLPGATGAGGSIWSALPAALRAQGLDRPVVLGLLAVDATTIDDWTRAGSPLRRALLAQLDGMRRAGLAPHRVLWQQGEADARAGTDPARYRQALGELAGALQAAGSDAPILLARSTICRSAPHDGLRAAIEATLREQPRRFRPGPDTDALADPAMRHDGCHFSGAGAQHAAALWARALAQQEAL